MENVKLKILDSKNIYGTMNIGTITLNNITDDDRIMLMHKWNLRPSNLIEDYHTMSLDEKYKIMLDQNLKPSELEVHQLTPFDKRFIFANHRKAFADANGFDYNKMFMADQDLEKSHKRGSYLEITQDYVEANPKGWTDIPEDILIISHKVPGVAIGHPVADCPVVMMEDTKQGVTAIAHCSATLIDQKMPMMIADALNQAYGTKDEDISIMVGPCAGPNWTYDKWPNWASDEKFWESSGAIVEENGEFKINLRRAICHQLVERTKDVYGLTKFDMTDTITDEKYYSNSVARSNPLKHGRQFNGVVYEKVRTR